MKESILAQYGLQASVCQYSGVPIVVAANFQHYPRLATALVLRTHPIFNVAITELLRAVRPTLQAGNPKEQHLLALALAHQAGFWTFKAPLHCRDDKAEKLLALVADTVREAVHSPVMIARENKRGKVVSLYPQYRITQDTAVAELIEHLRLIKDVLAQRSVMSDSEKLDWELSLEQELNKVLQHGGGYRPSYGRNAVQAVKDAWVRGKAGECDWRLVEFCLNVEKQPKIAQLQEAIDLLLDLHNGYDEFARAEGLQVVRFLEGRIEAIRRDEQDLGFVEIVSVKGAGATTEGGANYTVRTGVKEPATVVAAQPISTTLQAQIKAEWAVAGRKYTVLELLLETKKRQAATTQQPQGV